ncbi:polyamine-transporting ATPase 13A3-like [Danio aesculapii]|uniref:polyamine-transporting ATPase 13A3-like n=1 Tax=Danio aesculapii TaxID=1142201 RepID=UPI0024BF7CBF|nr:polyamine-transporting ATPase 13A3-like [Danio aesculapii]
MFFIMFFPISGIYQFLELVCVPLSWRVSMVIIILANTIVSVIIEGGIDMYGSKCFSWLCCQQRKVPKARYMHLAQELSVDPDWPPKPKSTTEAKPALLPDDCSYQIEAIS